MSDSDRVIASTWRRIGGGICDLIVLFIIITACSFIGLSDVAIGNARFSTSMSGWPFVIVLMLYWLCLAYMEYKTGKTPGKYLTGTRVLTEDYQKISFVQALLRNAFRVIDGIGFFIVGLIVIICTKENQRLGDLIAKTYVVEDSKGE